MSDRKDWSDMDDALERALEAEEEQADERGLDSQAKSALLRAEDDGFFDDEIGESGMHIEEKP